MKITKTQKFFDIAAFISFLPISLSPILALLAGTVSFETNTYVFFANISSYLALTTLILYVFGIICGEVKIQREHIVKNNLGLCLMWLFLVFVFISTASVGFNDLTVHGQQIRQEGILRYISYIVLFTLATTVKNRKFFNSLLYIFVCGITISAIVFVILNVFDINWTSVNSDGYTHRYKTSGILHNPNHYAYLLSATCGILAGVIFFSKKKFLIGFSIVVFAINFAALIYNKTLGSVLAVIAVVIFALGIIFFKLSAKAKKFTLIGLGVVIVGGIVYLFTDNPLTQKIGETLDIVKKGGAEADKLGSGRFGLWRSTLEYIKEKPLIGYGPDGISKSLLEEQGAARTHNIFLEYTAFFGIPAALVFITGYVLIFIKSLKNFTSANVTALLGCFAITMSLVTGISFGQTSPVLYMLLGMSIAQLRSEDEISFR
ncbi:MAG: O-antigen ligase family protein [Ruminococcus sp.]|nr:O-antigen ligase family protein [Ruminococcus sp.]